MEIASAERQPSLKGAPSFFRALVREASSRQVVGRDMNTKRGIRLDYGTAGRELGRHFDDYLSEEAKEELDDEILVLDDRDAFAKAMRSFVVREFPGCVALVPPKRRPRFFEGLLEGLIGRE